MRKLYDKTNPSTTMPGQQVAKGVKLRKVTLAVLGMLLTVCLNAQLVVTPNSNASDLAQALAGQGVVISNATRSGDAQGAGLFTANGTSLSIPSGVILTNGKVANASQPANNFASSSSSGNGDAQLQTLTGGYIYDKSVLEFDITPQGNLLRFDYVFVSEEYPEWVCSQFNDVFGFFISGPKPSGGNYTHVNIAKIPNTNLPVAINSINPGTSGLYGTASNCQSLAYSSLFRSNLTPTTNTDIVYDGMTKVLTAVAAVVPCKTYHLKLAVADVGDRIFDSGVFLQANSITSIPVTITSSTQLDYAGYNSAYEGCVSGKFTFSIPSPQPVDVMTEIQISGTATKGVDYPAIPTTITIPAGQTSKVITVLPTQDNIAEPAESIVISTVDVCTGSTLSSATMMLMDDVEPTISNATPSLCQGQSSQLNVTGGVSYTWTPAAGLNDASISNPVASPTANTTYTANISWGSCNKTLNTTVNVGGPAVTFTASPSMSSCNGSPVQVTASAGNANVTYNWSNGSQLPTITATTSGAYTVTVSDNSSCSGVATANISISNMAVSGATTNAACGTNNGSIALTVTGSTGTNTYAWSNGATTKDISGLIAGTYTVTVSNAGCSVSKSYSITQPNSTIAASAVASDINCNGANNGSISLSVTGGATPYSFNWSNNATTQHISNLAAGNYSVTITDGNGCALTKAATVNQPAAVNVSLTKTDVSCGGTNGTINLTATGGTGSYTYVWNDGNTNKNRTGLSGGTYTVTVKDGNNCSATQNATITQPAVVSVSLTATPTACSGQTGSASATATNGSAPYTFNWSHSNDVHTPSVNGLAAGNITVTVTDNAGCSTQASASITTSGTTSADFTYSGNQCEGGGDISFTHNGSASASHFWSFSNNENSTKANPSYTFAGAGAYAVTHIASEGTCADTVTKTIHIYGKPSISPTVTNASCAGGNNGSIQLSVSNGSAPYTFAWAGGATSQNRNNLGAGNYAVTVTDNHSCSATYSTSLIQSSTIVVNETHTDVACFGAQTGSINVTATGGAAPYSFAWSNNASSQNLAGIAAGNYTVSVTDANNCSALKTIAVAQKPKIETYIAKTDLTCNNLNNGALSVNVNGGQTPYTFNWNNGKSGASIANLAAGSYTVAVKDATGCEVSASATVNQPGPLALTETHTDPSCFNGTGSISLSIAGGTPSYTYQWSNNAATQNLAAVTAGQYTVTVTDGKGCQTMKVVTLTQPSALNVNTNVTGEICSTPNSGEIDVNVSGGTPPYQYRWNNNSTLEDQTSIAAGIYSLTVTDAKGCAETKESSVASASDLQLTANANQLSCEVAKGSIELTVTAGTAPYTFEWSNGETTKDLNNVLPGTYTVTVEDAAHCRIVTTTEIVNTNSFEVNITGNGPINLGETTELRAHTGNAQNVTYNWQPNLGLSCNNCAEATVKPATTTTYSVIATDENGCSAQDTATIQVAEENIFLPNAFTPNGDGVNDYLQLYGNLSSIKFVQLLVFDRWGEKVYETSDADFKWDGTYKGETLPPFSYIYVMKVVQLNGATSRTFKGSIALLN